MNELHTKLKETADRIREMREIFGYSEAEMAQKTDVSLAQYVAYEKGEQDFPFTFLHKCALVFGIGITDILEGHSANLTNYTINRAGEGQVAVDEDGIRIVNLASLFKNKIAEPHWVRYTYRPELQDKPIHTSTHSGQEFDFVISGQLKVQVGAHTEVLKAGDSIYYDSGTPHGMIAVGGEDCVFCAVVLPGEETDEAETARTIAAARPRIKLLCEKFVKTEEDETGALKKVSFENTDTYNFGFDTVDAIADAYPDKLAMIHVDKHHFERRFTFKDIKRESARAANYFASLGIKKGDRVMLVLKRHYQFWFAIVGLHKLGAIAIPATEQLMEKDFAYRFECANVSALVCTADGQVCHEAEKAMKAYGKPLTPIVVGQDREGWHNFDVEYARFSSHFLRTADTTAGD
ncbi:MAG: AMP-binding protein [Clostridia bacterium]|nr:AMP-binding protein [Clostridia bacterium]